MLPDRVSNPGPLTYESGALPIALRGPAHDLVVAVVGKLIYTELDSKDSDQPTHLHCLVNIFFSLRQQSIDSKERATKRRFSSKY